MYYNFIEVLCLFVVVRRWFGKLAVVVQDPENLSSLCRKVLRLVIKGVDFVVHEELRVEESLWIGGNLAGVVFIDLFLQLLLDNVTSWLRRVKAH